MPPHRLCPIFSTHTLRVFCFKNGLLLFSIATLQVVVEFLSTVCRSLSHMAGAYTVFATHATGIADLPNSLRSDKAKGYDFWLTKPKIYAPDNTCAFGLQAWTFSPS